VECGFLSNPKDEQLLQSAAFHKRLAGVIAAGITDFFAGISA
jgi:N-acetylmuramoyl-L-alanine amidase